MGSDQPVVLMDALRLAEKLIGKKAKIEYRPRHPADILVTWANIEKAKQLLGWRPRIGLSEGMTKLVKWYEDNREWVKDVPTYSL